MFVLVWLFVSVFVVLVRCNADVLLACCVVVVLCWCVVVLLCC